jgi:Carboxypeptidase regulatory-like domain
LEQASDTALESCRSGNIESTKLIPRRSEMKRSIPIVLFLLCLSTWAQLPTATLTGVVTDQQGAVIAGADVTLTNEDTGATRHSPTRTDGRYVFPNLLPGNYDVRVTARGFTIREFKAIHLEVGRSVTLDSPLQVAKGNEIVTVTGGATGGELTQSEVQGQVTEGTLQNIPLNGRNYLELAFLLPGNRPATNFDPTKTNTARGFFRGTIWSRRQHNGRWGR